VSGFDTAKVVPDGRHGVYLTCSEVDQEVQAGEGPRRLASAAHIEGPLRQWDRFVKPKEELGLAAGSLLRTVDSIWMPFQDVRQSSVIDGDLERRPGKILRRWNGA